jgi:photosystem II stability/assembly factor-like uncharacterized protein
MGWQGTNALIAVQFVSPRRGWVVGVHQILATSDGGRHWSVQASGHLDLDSVDFVDSQHGWAVGASTLLATSDGGQHWTLMPEPCPKIRLVDFVSPRVGFAVAGGTNLVGASFSMAPLRGGVLLTTRDGGRTWRRLQSPPDAQAVCFDSPVNGSPANGWLGADGSLFRTSNGGRSWELTSARVRSPSSADPAFMLVQCAGPDSAWALAIGPGAGMSQEPHVGFHAGPSGTTPIFAEQYFPHPGIRVTTESPGSYPGAISAISETTAAFIDGCPACGNGGTAPWALATAGGSTLIRKGNVAGLTSPLAASFVSPQVGWVVGLLIRYRSGGPTRSYPRIVSTTDGGRTWHLDYTESPSP